MRRNLAALVLFGLAGIGMSGCKRHSAPAPTQPVVRTLPPIKTQPDFPMGSVAPPRIEENASTGARKDLHRPEAQPAGVAPAETQAALEAAQRRQDAVLLQQQQAASRRQQEELDRQVEQNMKAQQQIQAEPRIQEVPEKPITQPSPQGIQDQPRPPGPTF
jgi:hypothetical protein